MCLGALFFVGGGEGRTADGAAACTCRGRSLRLPSWLFMAVEWLDGRW